MTVGSVEVRLIGGQWKRSKLTVPAVEGVRPTPDRVRETLFNWLGPNLLGLRCVDAFAGTGALGFEAASRGAAEVQVFDQQASLVKALRANAQRLHATSLRIQQGDALRLMAALPAGQWDVVFLDPPFAQASPQPSTSPDHAPGVFTRALAQAARLMAPQGKIYLEAPQPWTDEALTSVGLSVHRSGKAGAVHYHLLHRLSATQAPTELEPLGVPEAS